ncbi:hypothetical protein FQN54_001750 [Arachnomyces sp. PD_36]|nr:hypothetical protein FQN54_001750 [Arachnomyces sp. PD_36]
MDEDTKRTIVLVYVFGFLSLVLMGLRLVLRKVRRQSFNLSDYLTMCAIVFVVNRSVMTTIVLLWGNNNVDDRETHVFTDQEIYQRTIGSQLTMANRVIYNTYIWVQKGVVLLLYHRMLSGLPFPEMIIKGYWITLVATMIPVQVTTFCDCFPVTRYWQVVPDPGSCIESRIQLFVLIALNVATDVMLIVLPMPYLIRVKRSFFQRLQLIGLFSIGLLLIVIALIRLPVWGSGTAQVNRNTWGSVEEFFAAFVANVPTLFTLRRRVEQPVTGYGYNSGTNKSGSGGVGGFFDDNIVVTRRFDLEHEMEPRPKRSSKSRFSKQSHKNRASDEDLIYQGRPIS